MITLNKENFWDGSFAVWQNCIKDGFTALEYDHVNFPILTKKWESILEINPSAKIVESPNKSKFCITDKVVYRFAHHWGQVGNCIWPMFDKRSLSDHEDNYYGSITDYWENQKTILPTTYTNRQGEIFVMQGDEWAIGSAVISEMRPLIELLSDAIIHYENSYELLVSKSVMQQTVWI